MSELLKVFAQRLKQARILKKMSMDQLVANIGGIITKQAISKYETANHIPAITTVGIKWWNIIMTQLIAI